MCLLTKKFDVPYVTKDKDDTQNHIKYRILCLSMNSQMLKFEFLIKILTKVSTLVTRLARGPDSEMVMSAGCNY